MNGEITATRKVACANCASDFGPDPQGGGNVYITTASGDVPVPDDWQVEDWPAAHGGEMGKIAYCPHLDVDELRKGWPAQ